MAINDNVVASTTLHTSMSSLVVVPYRLYRPLPYQLFLILKTMFLYTSSPAVQVTVFFYSNTQVPVKRFIYLNGPIIFINCLPYISISTPINITSCLTALAALFWAVPRLQYRQTPRNKS